MNGRNIRLVKNTAASLVFQVTTILCGFILPRLILNQYGSEVNGLVSSITQFLGIIGFLELGVGSVIQSTLYKPLADRDNEKISEIIVSGQSFFSKLARILLVYVVILVIVYPFIAKQNFGWIYTATLIIAMSISSFAQYYFGIVDRLLLTADQKGCIQYNSQTISLILNTTACAIFIYFGASIHIVKLTTSLIYLARPLFIRLYINRHYKINRKVCYTEEPIKQKWNGVAQHVSAVVLDSTDSIVLTVLASLSDVSIYSVYHLVIYGVKQLLISMTNGIQSLLGELWAKQELDELKKTFGWSEWAIHTGTVFVFGCTGILILPFISIYTSGIYDANYIQPLFAVLITLAHAGHCLRLPYNIMILACGHYKQTQHCYIIAAILNIVVSVTTVKLWGLIGVAIGTLMAMLFQTVWMAYYNSQSMLKWPFINFLKQLLVDVVTVIIAVGMTYWIPMIDRNFFWWIVLSVEVAAIWGGVMFVINYLLYKDKVIKLLTILKRKFIKK